jgi:hypothetical protein
MISNLKSIVSDKDLAAIAAATGSASPLEVEFEACAYMLRGGPAMTTNLRVIGYIDRMSEEQLRQIVKRLTRTSPSNSAVWKPNEIRDLVRERIQL